MDRKDKVTGTRADLKSHSPIDKYTSGEEAFASSTSSSSSSLGHYHFQESNFESEFLGFIRTSF